VFNTAPKRDAIMAAISRALAHARQPTVSPYGDGESSRRFAAAIAAIPDFRQLLRKSFHDISSGGAEQ
jgi:UDP-N-acetylglucosamine 2-epimerase (non-hydrolysing)/GDP/UDP-N,N'-diacetylbacillosamine 2-epimerase (hydrolysing)